MILTKNMLIYFLCYFDIDQGHSDRYCANGRQSWSEMEYRFLGEV